MFTPSIHTVLNIRVLQFFTQYDRALTRYMRKGQGVGLDLTLVWIILSAGTEGQTTTAA